MVEMIPGGSLGGSEVLRGDDQRLADRILQRRSWHLIEEEGARATDVRMSGIP